ncbi:acyltransferase family protein [Edaphobacter aggregans]|uniref:acyltransferase family protein n=1 Tax=Edaphobacter aggregans TaxID=570835 RepID=UPI00068C24E2|nr:acyltransferase [Edaphobacter aggregans]
MTEATKHGRISQLDGVRTIAILTVVLNHAFSIKLLWIGVDLFFILSGFLITGILLKHKKYPLGRYFKGFYSRRVRRILPPYALLMIVTTILFGTAWMKHAYLYVLLMNFILAFSLEDPRRLACYGRWLLKSSFIYFGRSPFIC